MYDQCKWQEFFVEFTACGKIQSVELSGYHAEDGFLVLVMPGWTGEYLYARKSIAVEGRWYHVTDCDGKERKASKRRRYVRLSLGLYSHPITAYLHGKAN